MASTKGTLTLKGVVPKRLIGAGRYLVSGSPRHGGIAAVYRAYDTLEERNVALKVFRAVRERDEIVEESFRRETQALSDLRHQNIIEICDSGIDEETGEHFIAMEWVEQDLESLRAKTPFKTWDEFYRTVGRSILEAIAYAHTHSIVHRDIKPSNILVTTDGVVKVCDFGISKIRNFLEPGVTLSQYASLPYAPPEPDDGSYSYTRDVFGFAALCVTLLSPKAPQDHGELHRALDRLDLEHPLKALLRRSLSIEAPADRPVTGAVLLGELERLTPKRIGPKAGTILLALTKKVRDILNVDVGITKEEDAFRFVASDLGDPRAVLEDGEGKPTPDGAPPLGRTIRLFGNKYGYIAIMAPPAGDKLLLVSALEYLTSHLEECRDEAYEPAYALALAGVTSSASAENIRKLQEALLDFEATQKADLVERRKQAIYNTWLGLLNAKTELEQRRKRQIRYIEVEPSGAAVRFLLSQGTDTGVLDEQDVRVELANDREFTGTVVSLSDDSVLVVPNDRNRVEATDLPESGALCIDTTKADAALDKQKTALEAVRFGRSVNPSLGSFIVSPAEVPVPRSFAVSFIDESIDDDKKNAVQVAMSNPDLLVVQGPPGTGKTTFITEVVLQTLRREPEARILLTSQTHVALDNSLERITSRSEGSVQAVRIGNENDERIASSTKGMLIDNKLPVLKKLAIADGRAFLEEWAAGHGVDLTYVRIAMALDRHASLKELYEKVEARIGELRPILNEDRRNALDPDVRADLDQELNDRLKERDGLARDMKESFGEIRRYESDKDTLEHWADCSAEQLRGWAVDYAPKTAAAAQLRKLLAAHSDWESRFGRNREFRAALIAASQVVAGTCLGVMSIPGRQEIEYDLCIVDEASIATPTEVLVPMSRARRTILVGDRRQLSPFQDPELQKVGLLAKYRLSPQDQKTTLFNHFSELLPVALTKSLTTQHRMLPAIGNLISDCFYSGELKSVPRAPKDYLAGPLRRHVVWFSTSRFANRGSRRTGTTYVNDLEVQQIIGLMARMNFAITKGKWSENKLTIAILTGYGAQKDQLRAAIDVKRREWEAFRDIFVNVVDAFQGREADVLIFSVTRSDDRGLGFLQEMARINVALSRGKEYLVIVGDHLFCQEADSRRNPLKDVIDYIRRHPDDCVLEEVAP